MTTAQAVETSVTVNNNSPIQDYVHPDDQTQPTFFLFCWQLVSIFEQNNKKKIVPFFEGEKLQRIWNL